jgi:hypothetical protein
MSLLTLHYAALRVTSLHTTFYALRNVFITILRPKKLYALESFLSSSKNFMEELMTSYTLDSKSRRY